MGFVAVVFLVSALSQLVASQQKACIPVIVEGMHVNPEKLIGTWHEYQSSDGADDTTALPSFNVINEFTRIPSSHRHRHSTITTNWTLSFQAPGENPGEFECSGIHGQLNFRANGKRTGLAFLPADDTVPEDVTYTTIFTDYHLVEIDYRCRFRITNQSRTDTTKYCQDPLFWILTRIPPYKLTQKQKSYIHAVVNHELFNYCFSNKNFAFTGSSPKVAPCTPKAPAGFAALIANA